MFWVQSCSYGSSTELLPSGVEIILFIPHHRHAEVVLWRAHVRKAELAAERGEREAGHA